MFNANAQNWFGVNHHDTTLANHGSNITSTITNGATTMQHPNNLHQMNGNHQYHPQQQQQQLHHHHPNNMQTNSTPANVYLRKRSVSNSNPALDRPMPLSTAPDIHVEYEVAVPFVPTYRHTPYHSLWDLHEW